MEFLALGGLGLAMAVYSTLSKAINKQQEEIERLTASVNRLTGTVEAIDYVVAFIDDAEMLSEALKVYRAKRG